MTTSIPAAAVAVPPVTDGSTALNTGNTVPGKDLAATGADDFTEFFETAMQDAQVALPELSLPATEQVNAAALTSATAVTGDGKNLPTVAWSGMLAVADDAGTDAILFGGDNSTTGTGKAAQIATLPVALQPAQFNANTDPALMQAANDARQFTETLQQVQANLPEANVSRIMPDAASSLTQLSGFATASNSLVNPSALSYATTARLDQPVGALPLPVNHPNWGTHLGDSVRWMTGQQMQMADLRLNPPELGMLEVRIQINSGDQTSITFSSPHAAVRDAVEQALPRLRDMLDASGVQLGDVNVSQHSFAHQQRQQDNMAQQDGSGTGTNSENPADEELAFASKALTYPRVGTGLVDLYA